MRRRNPSLIDEQRVGRPDGPNANLVALQQLKEQILFELSITKEEKKRTSLQEQLASVKEGLKARGVKNP